jgi:sulfur relay (sulfurtransferase) DsrC/TusE family protein
MKLFLVLCCAVLVAGSVSAQGVYNMAKQQAKNAASGESTQPGVNPPAAATPPTPPDPVLQATMRNINNLRVDFENFDSSPTNTRPLIKDLTDAAQGTKPSPPNTANLAQDLAAAIAGNQKLHAQHQKLAQYVHALFNGSHLSPAQQQMVLDALKKILTDGGVSADDSAKVISDLKTIATETK